LWVGRRFTTDEASERYGIEVRKIEDLESFLKGNRRWYLHGFDEDLSIQRSRIMLRDAELVEFVSVARLIKDDYEDCGDAKGC